MIEIIKVGNATINPKHIGNQPIDVIVEFEAKSPSGDNTEVIVKYSITPFPELTFEAGSPFANATFKFNKNAEKFSRKLKIFNSSPDILKNDGCIVIEVSAIKDSTAAFRDTVGFAHL